MSITDARVANPFERDRIGSLGQEQTGYDLYQKEKKFAAANPPQTFGLDAFLKTARRHSSSPQTNFSLLGRMQPEGDNLEEEFENMSTQLFRDLLLGNPAIGQKPGFGEAGQKLRDKIKSTGGEYRVQDAYNERMDLIDEFKQEVLGPYGSIDSLLKAQRLAESESYEYGERYDDPNIMSGVTGALFSDKAQTGVPMHTDENAPFDFAGYKQELQANPKIGPTKGEMLLGEDGVLYTRYASEEDARNDNTFLSNAKDVGLDSGFWSAGMKDTVGKVIRLEGQNREDGFYIPLTTIDEGQKSYITNVVSREDEFNIAGQTLGLVEIAASPIQGIYSGIFKGYGRTVNLAFDEVGKLTLASYKALENIGANPNAIRQIENQAQDKIKYMYSGSTKEVIQKPAPKPKQTTAKTETEAKNILLSKDSKVNEVKVGDNIYFTVKQDQIGSFGGSGSKVYRKAATFAQHVKNTNSDKKLIKLYDKIVDGKIKIENIPKRLRPRFEEDGFFTKEFTELTSKERNQLTRTLQTYDRYLTFKGNNLDKIEMLNLLRKEIDSSFYLPAGVNPEDFRPFQQKLYDILEPEVKSNVGGGQGGMGYGTTLFKPLTKTKIKKIQKLWNERGYHPVTNVVVDRVETLINNPKFFETIMGRLNKGIFKNGKRLPDLSEVQKIKGLENIKPQEMATAIIKITQKMNAENIQMPFKKENAFSKIGTRKKRAADLYEVLMGGESFGYGHFYSKAARLAANRQIDAVLSRPLFSGATMFKRSRTKFNVPETIDFHEPASVTVAVANGMHSYANFIIPIDRVLNRNTLPRHQGRLSSIIGQIKNKEISLEKGIKIYDEYLNKIQRANPGVAIKGNLATLMKPSEVKKYYEGMGYNLKELKEKYGMDLVAEAKKAGFAFKIPKKAMITEEFFQKGGFGYKTGNAMGGTPIRRDKFAEPAGSVGQDPSIREDEIDKRKGVFARYLDLEQEKAATQLGLESMPESQQKQMAFFLADPIEGQQRIEREKVADASVRYKVVPKEDSISNIQAKIAEQMIDAKPTKFPLSSFPKLLTENPLTKSLDRQMKTPFLILASAANDIINKMGGDEKQFYERFPRLSEYLSSGFQPVSATAQEAAYIDGIDEINRAMETGVRNLGFNTMDLVLGGIDLTGFGDGKLSERLRENYEKTAKNDPETFMGDMIALLTEFGVPGGLVTKLITRFQKAMRLKGFNTMTRYIDDDTVGAARFAMQASNIAKRMGTGAVIFGAADFVGGGPYSSLKRMFPEDATLLPGKPIDTTDLSGADLALANFKNRVRFGADGALIGGLFPLLGPPAWALTKGTLALPFKTIPGVNRSVFGGALQLAGVPLKIAADSLAGKIPYTSKTIPLVGNAISYLGKQGATAAQATAAFIGKQVFTRAALGIYDLANARASIYTGIKPPSAMFTKSLPDFQTWRRLSVNSKDPLHQYLAKIDNKLAMFRDIGKLGKDAFATMTQSDLYIRSKSRAVEKYLIDVERIAYKLAKAFEERHQKYGEFETIQKKYLDDVLDFLEGTIRVDQLPKQLQVPANDLRNYTNSLKKEFGELLPTTDPIKYLIDADINSMMRRSFAAFTNNSYAPTPRSVDTAKTFIKDLIRGNNGLRMEAEMAFPNKTIDEAIDEYASLKVADIMHTAKYEMADPFRALENITRKLNLEDEIKLVTGDELPSAIKKLLGEEKNLRSSLLQTTGNIIASTSQKKSLDRIAEMGLANGWLFRTKEEALGKGILNAAPLTDVKGSGFLLNDAIGLYGTPEIIKQLGGYSLFDGFLKSTIYQNILAAKAMVQGGKTLYSPATQMRNVGSAALFALNVGHIGGSASVPQAFKIVMDDIFGPGRNVDKKQLNKFIERKIELGVIDEIVVAQELTAILNDLKGATKETGEPVISSFNQLIQRVGNTQLSQYVQRLYAGGDNLWKLYGHEFYISELKQFTKSIDDVKRYFSDIVGREFVELSPKTGGKKTVMEGIEEIAAHLVRDTYPTYSRVPPAIQAIRKLPIGNFISFPAEMLRTTATTLSTSLKHIASGNPGLQSMGYRSLFGQFTTLYGVNEAVKSLGHTLTDVSPEAIRAYQDGLGPSFMENHLMVPLTNKDPQTGEFKAFDLSSYNPYAYVLDPIEGFMRELGTTRMSVDEVEGEVYNRIFDAGGPLMALIEPFTAETILLEPMFDIWARQGRARNGATVFSPTDDFGTKVSKSFNHIIGTVAPGFVRSTGQVLNALSLDTKQGRVSELADVFIRLLGGSIINVDPVSALDYKAIDIREIRSNAYKTEHFFSKENALERGPDVMAAEFQQIQNEALAAQFEVYKMFAQALDSGLLTREQIESVLGPDGRNVPNLDNLMDGFFTPVSYSESGLEQRADELYQEYLKSGIVINRSDLLPLSKLDGIIFKMENIRFKDLVDPERPPLPQPTGSGSNIFFGEQQEPVTPQLPDTPTPVVPNTNMNPVNPATGLTTTETALLSPGEQAIRQRQKGMA